MEHRDWFKLHIEHRDWFKLHMDEEFNSMDVTLTDDLSLGGYESSGNGTELVDLTCHLCNETFITLRDLEQHVVIHTQVNKEFKPFKCPMCDKKFLKYNTLRLHMTIHSEDGAKNECVYCKKRFAIVTDLRRHLRTHTGERPYKCSVCSKSFGREYTLKIHMLTHNRQRKVYKCKLCQIKFVKLSEVNRHYMEQHAGRKGNTYTCNCCCQYFPVKHDFVKHIECCCQSQTLAAGAVAAATPQPSYTAPCCRPPPSAGVAARLRAPPLRSHIAMVQPVPGPSTRVVAATPRAPFAVTAATQQQQQTTPYGQMRGESLFFGDGGFPASSAAQGGYTIAADQFGCNCGCGSGCRCHGNSNMPTDSRMVVIRPSQSNPIPPCGPLTVENQPGVVLRGGQAAVASNELALVPVTSAKASSESKGKELAGDRNDVDDVVIIKSEPEDLVQLESLGEDSEGCLLVFPLTEIQSTVALWPESEGKAVYFWPECVDGIEFPASLVLYHVRELSTAIRDRDGGRLYKMLFEITEEERRKYEYVVSLEEGLDSTMRSGFRKTQCDQILWNFHDAVQQKRVFIRSDESFDSVSSVGVLIDTRNDTSGKIRKKLGESSKMYSWDVQTFSEILRTWSDRGADADAEDSKCQFNKLRAWILAKLNQGDCNVTAKPLDLELQSFAVGREQNSITCKLYHDLQKCSANIVGAGVKGLLGDLSITTLDLHREISTEFVFILPIVSSVVSVDYEKYCTLVISNMTSAFKQSKKYVFVLDVMDPAKLLQSLHGFTADNYSVCCSVNAEHKRAACIMLTVEPQYLTV
ncbi:PREDICTED: uncharacterized protein LOC106813427 [Priapulus caudatus]|uniref:Uncharacterized protein LOC106813427 n=1 Tax=Priapulus caudatus TaxID=37621 RepID=A0ABM1ELH4_PRICU|nr:PREDICTED: uncharacterized protein LOC106813427 [Priapulus caudatus]